MRVVFIATGLALVLSACVPTLEAKAGADRESASEPVATLPSPPDRECSPEYYRFAFVATGTTVFRQGETVKVTPTVDSSPFGSHDLPLRCVSDWAVSGPAKFTDDRRAFVIAEDAPVGSVVRVSFKHDGVPVVGEFKVIGRDEIVLTGRYSQKAISGCQVAEAVRELEFMPGDRFSVTYNPFETYRDYWGSYSFDPATKRIRLTVEGGNFVPPRLDLEGEAELAGGQLVLKGLFLGSRGGPPPGECTYTF